MTWLHSKLGLFFGLGLLVGLGCSGASKPPPAAPRASITEKDLPPKPPQLVLVSTPLVFQDEEEPYRIQEIFEFELPERPRRARLKLRYSGVPGALSEDYRMGRYRHRVELNSSFLMDLNTFAESEAHVVEYTKWISVGMFRRHNRLEFKAGDDGNPTQPKRDSFELRSVVLEFDW